MAVKRKGCVREEFLCSCIAHTRHYLNRTKGGARCIRAVGTILAHSLKEKVRRKEKAVEQRSSMLGGRPRSECTRTLRVMEHPPIRLARVKTKEAWLELAVRGRHVEEVTLRARDPHTI